MTNYRIIACQLAATPKKTSLCALKKKKSYEFSLECGISFPTNDNQKTPSFSPTDLVFRTNYPITLQIMGLADHSEAYFEIH